MVTVVGVRDAQAIATHGKKHGADLIAFATKVYRSNNKLGCDLPSGKQT